MIVLCTIHCTQKDRSGLADLGNEDKVLISGLMTAKARRANYDVH